MNKRSRWSWLLAVSGWLVMAYAVRGLFAHASQTHPISVLKLVIGGDLLHDIVIAPVVLAVGVLIVARLRGLRRPATVGLVISAVVALYALPFVRGYGRDGSTPSRLPNNYATGLAVVLACVWAAVIVGALAVHARSAARARRVQE